jgi:hypothetical protein
VTDTTLPENPILSRPHFGEGIAFVDAFLFAQTP